jgi:CheY-like chemotaxis protein
MGSPESVVIVLAEDDDGQASLVERNIRRAGFTNGFIRLKDGQEALDFFKSEGAFAGVTPPATMVLLLDINMPRIDGIEVLRQLRGSPDTSMIPIIMLTTTDNPKEIDRCYQLGCNVYITKPVEPDAFIESIKRLGFFLQVVKLPKNGKATKAE